MNKLKGWKKINQGYRCFHRNCDLRKEKEIFPVFIKIKTLFGDENIETRYICEKCKQIKDKKEISSSPIK